MTIRERLFEAGLTSEYDEAAMNRDREKLREILGQVGLTPEESKESVDTLLSDPGKYGY